ncbi:MAG: hypothetical protein MAG453_01184 [Calditrichaeota bacterium]|nr:hypothetical protein [Calditrichota bacterium]
MQRNGLPALVAVTAAVLIACSAPAQPPMMDRMRQQRLFERIEMMRIWKLTELLDLDSERAAVFFPRYQAHLSEMDSLHRSLQRVIRAIGDGLRRDSADFAMLRDHAERLERELTGTRLQFIDDNADVLNARQQASLLLFEHRFEQRLREMIQEVQREQGPPYGPRHRGGRGRGPPPGRGPWPDTTGDR